MSAKIIPFPGALVSKPDPLDRLAERLATAFAELPPAEDAGEQLQLLRRIDQQLTQLAQVLGQGGVQ